MLIPKSDRKLIHESLFKEGVLVAKKDFECQHQELPVKNLYVIKACQSLNSRGYVKTRFSWCVMSLLRISGSATVIINTISNRQWYYYTLTPEGLDFLREWLHLPAEIVPATHIKQQRSHAAPRGMMGGDDRPPRGPGTLRCLCLVFACHLLLLHLFPLRTHS